MYNFMKDLGSVFLCVVFFKMEIYLFSIFIDHLVLCIRCHIRYTSVKANQIWFYFVLIEIKIIYLLKFIASNCQGQDLKPHSLTKEPTCLISLLPLTAVK